jgi:ABC-type multidrug transport system ATPase subunit
VERRSRAPDHAPLLEIREHPDLEGPAGPGHLHLAAGELAFLTGESGSGKTRLLRQLLDLEPGLGGRALLGGREITGLEPAELRRRIGLLPQELPNHSGSGRELLRSMRGFARNRGRWLDELEVAGWCELLELEAHLEKEIRTLSGGEKRRLSLLLLAVSRPELMLLDEPESGLDPRRRSALDEYVRIARAEGTAVLWITHLEASGPFADAPRYSLVRGAR